MTKNIDNMKSRRYLDYEFSLKSGKEVSVRDIYMNSLNEFDTYDDKEKQSLEQILDNLLRNYEREIFLVYDKYKESIKNNSDEVKHIREKYTDLIHRICKT
jgi:hypothetical protein